MGGTLRGRDTCGGGLRSWSGERGREAVLEARRELRAVQSLYSSLAGGVCPCSRMSGRELTGTHPSCQTRRMKTFLGAASAVALGFLSCRSLALVPSFEGIGTLPGGTLSYANGISGDGFTVVGSSVVSGHTRAFRWTHAGGMLSLGTIPNFPETDAEGVSFDGSVIAGGAAGNFGPGGNGHAFKWTLAGGMVDLGGFVASVANGVSADGTVVVGGRYVGNYSNAPSNAFTWTSSGTLDLGNLPGGSSSSAFAASGDGTIVVGQSYIQGEACFARSVGPPAQGCKTSVRSPAVRPA